MKKFLFILGLCTLGLSSPSFAAGGCGVWGKVSYVYITASGTDSTMMGIINGGICMVWGPPNAVIAAAAILAQARVSGVQAYLAESSPGRVDAALESLP